MKMIYLKRNITTKPRNTEVGAFKYSDSDRESAKATSKLIQYWTKKGFKDYSAKFRKPKLELKISDFRHDPFDIIINDYQFKHIEFGNWVTNEDRFNYLLQFIIALHDLNKVLNFNDNLGLWQSQSIAFGAHGAGSALAHYEYWNGFINLTRYKRSDRKAGSKDDRFTSTGGIGSFAHEYGHVLDFFFAQYVEKRGQGRTLSTSKDEGHDSTRTRYTKEELKGDSLHAQMNRILFNVIWYKYDFNHPNDSVHTEYYKNLKMTFSKEGSEGKSKNKYWFEKCEIWARLFEQYVQYKLKHKGIHNVFLAKRKYEDNRYLPEAELKRVVSSIDYLMKSMSRIAHKLHAIKK